VHDDCQQRYDLVASKIPQFIVQAKDSAISGARLNELTIELAATGFIDGGLLNQLTATGIRDLAAVMTKPLTKAEANRIVELRDAFGLTDQDIGQEVVAELVAVRGNVIVVPPKAKEQRIPAITVEELADALTVYFSTVVGFKREMIGLDSDRGGGVKTTTIIFHGPVVPQLDRRSKIEVDIYDKATTNMNAKLGSDQFVVHPRSQDVDVSPLKLGLLVEPQADRSIAIFRITKWDHGQAYFERPITNQ
jgi:hypothetical protein